jgi:hypothetical protein
MSWPIGRILFWSCFLGLAAWSIWRRFTRVDRLEIGACLLCGYDLRSASTVCPECGLPVPPYEERIDLESEAESGVRGWQELVVNGPVIEPRAPGSDERRITIYQTKNYLEAVLLGRKLSASGINCGVQGRQLRRGLLKADLSLVVWSEDAQVAKEMIEELNRRREKHPEPRAVKLDYHGGPAELNHT